MFIGSVAGENYGTGSITACYNTGEALEPGYSYGTGGVANTDSGTITACYWVPSSNTLGGTTAGDIPGTIEFSAAGWPAGNGDAEPAWRIGSADGSGTGHYWKSMGNKSGNPGPNDGPKLWWETP